MKKVYIDTGVGRRLIGQIEDGVFLSHRLSSKHLYRKLNAWGIDCKAFEGMLKNQQLDIVKIVDKDTNLTYITKAENFKEHGTILHFKPHRSQIFLPLEHWEVEG